MKSVIEAVFDLKHDGNLFLTPAGMILRGRRDFMRVAAHHPSAVMLHTEFPRGLPSTLLRISLDESSVTLVEPLRTDEWLPEAERLRAKGIEIPQDVHFNHVHISDWLHALRRAMNAGHATLVKGELPKDLGQESRTELPTAEQKNVDRLDRLCGLVETLLERLTSAATK